MATVMMMVKGMVVALVMTMMVMKVMTTSYDQAAVGQRSQLCEY